VYKIQTVGDIFSISENLQIIIQEEDMEDQVHHIQVLLADELDRYKGKRKLTSRETY